MTREEAIELLHDIQTDAVYNVLSSEKEALDMAIKALEQQPCDDAISRETVLEIIEKEEFKGDAIYGIERLPSVTPTRPTARWETFVEDYNKCSKCGEMGKLYRIYKYCPACGARMTESEEA